MEDDLDFTNTVDYTIYKSCSSSELNTYTSRILKKNLFMSNVFVEAKGMNVM